MRRSVLKLFSDELRLPKTASPEQVLQALRQVVREHDELVDKHNVVLSHISDMASLWPSLPSEASAGAVAAYVRSVVRELRALRAEKEHT
jgi:hypothetical protein